MKQNILITSVGKRVVLVRIFQKTLKELGLDGKVYSVDMRPEMSPAGYVSEECMRVPRCTESNYVDALLQICREKEIAVVVPTIDTELQVLSENRGRFQEQGVQLVLSDPDFIRACGDKRLTKSLFGDLRISVPRMLDKEHATFPMFAKPYDGSLSVNTHIIKDEEDLTADILEDPKMLFMEYIDKKEYREYTVDMYYGLDHRVKGIVPRERLEIRAGEINKGITRKNEIVGYLKERMETVKGVRGCICLQLFYRESDHDIKGIEINPRFGGGFPLAYYAKANFVESILREYMLGETVDYSDDWLDKTLMLRYDDDVIIHDAEA